MMLSPWPSNTHIWFSFYCCRSKERKECSICCLTLVAFKRNRFMAYDNTNYHNNKWIRALDFDLDLFILYDFREFQFLIELLFDTDPWHDPICLHNSCVLWFWLKFYIRLSRYFDGRIWKVMKSRETLIATSIPECTLLKTKYEYNWGQSFLWTLTKHSNSSSSILNWQIFSKWLHLNRARLLFLFALWMRFVDEHLFEMKRLSWVK